MNTVIKQDRTISLTRKSLTGAAWTTAGFGFSQILRFVSNLILTRLLAPEFFGINAIVNVIMIGLNMFSDIGLGPNVIQSPRSKDPDFINTAWSLQIVRGFNLWIACVIAAYPFSVFYHEPLLLYLLPVAGLSTIINGFDSTKLLTNNRDLNMVRLTLIEVGSQIFVILVMVGLAKIHSSVWVLVVGTLAGAVVKLITSHVALPGIKNRFIWNKDIIKELIKFGRWIFFSTALTFANNSMGSLIMGKLVSMSDVGVFSIAATLAKTVENVFNQLANKILFPLYTKIKDLPYPELIKRVKKIRIAVNAFFLPMLWVLVIWGEEIIKILFDNRYVGAGWILRIFALGLIPTIITGIGPFYLSLGNSKLMLMMSGIRFISSIGSMLIGWHFAQSNGVIVGMSCYTVFIYFAEIIVQRSYKIWVPLIDVLCFLSTFIFLGSILLIKGF